MNYEGLSGLLKFLILLITSMVFQNCDEIQGFKIFSTYLCKNVRKLNAFLSKTFWGGEILKGLLPHFP